jgi:hypothetical protein
MQNLTPAWKAVCLLPLVHFPQLNTYPRLQPWVENLTGTRGAYRSYNTSRPKVEAWQPKVAARAKPLE